MQIKFKVSSTNFRAFNSVPSADYNFCKTVWTQISQGDSDGIKGKELVVEPGQTK